MTTSDRIRLICRFIAAVINQQEAEAVQQQIVDALSSVCRGEVTDRIIQPYWKLEGTYEIAFDVIVEEPLCSFRKILDAMGHGWELHGADVDSWAIWNPGNSNTFCCDAVLWGNAEQYRNPKDLH